jgi:hypothetical protein
MKNLAIIDPSTFVTGQVNGEYSIGRDVDATFARVAISVALAFEHDASEVIRYIASKKEVQDSVQLTTSLDDLSNEGIREGTLSMLGLLTLSAFTLSPSEQSILDGLVAFANKALVLEKEYDADCVSGMMSHALTFTYFNMNTGKVVTWTVFFQ